MGQVLQTLVQRENRKTKKKCFDAYWSKEDVQRGLKQGTLIQGQLRINPKNYEDAYVPHPDMKSDVYIAGTVGRNRALNADVVVVQLSPKDEWKVLVDDLTRSETDDRDDQVDDITKSTQEMTVEDTPTSVTTPASTHCVGDASTVATPMQCHAAEKPCAAGSSQKKPHGTPRKQNPSVKDFLQSETANIKTSPVARRLFGTSEANSVVQKMDAIPDKCLLRTGRVVYIVEKNHSRACTGHIKPMQDGNPSIVLFSPLDHRVPRIQIPVSECPEGMSCLMVITVYPASRFLCLSVLKIPVSECPEGYLQRAGDFKNTLYIARITEWENPNYAKGTLARSLGEAGEIEPETEGILIENGIDYGDFPPQALNDLPKNLPWRIPSEEFTKRRDLRTKCIFTIDPATARDLDDAISCESLGNGEYEVGVHIADVTYFLPPDTCLDTVAGSRATSVYLVQKVVPMLPRLLCEELCSLNPDVDRLTFSVVWKVNEQGEVSEESCYLVELMEQGEVSEESCYLVELMEQGEVSEESCYLVELMEQGGVEGGGGGGGGGESCYLVELMEQGEVLDEWFGRSVIRSCAKLSYNHAQGFIEEPAKEWSKEELPSISEPFTSNDIRDRVLNLNKIAVNIRKKRFDTGALRLDQVKIQFTLDSETGLPSGYSVYKQHESNMLIEEFMLLANMAVAHRIYKSFPDLAVLRRHPPPQEKLIDSLIKTCKSLGIPIKADSAGELQRSLSAYSNSDSKKQAAKMQILTVLCSKPMQNARYFCTGCLGDEEEFRHYALNVPLYTHFTSPIRRYADVMVHRLLAAAIGCGGATPLTKDTARKRCVQCNTKKQTAKRVQDLSNDLFFAIFVKECGPLEETGMVMEVLDRSFDVVMLRLGVVKRVYCEKLPLVNHSFKKGGKPVLTLKWATDDTHTHVVEQPISIFSVVTCVLKADAQPLKWTAVIKHPDEAVNTSGE
ncbi:DIS3-like exonuclease 2 [Lamellibrachia satsuma]|nr:DIS3-like exonuclease 2 [Lamellibrachia satsuma]